MGSMCEARRAEMYPATRATTHKTAITPANVAGSVGRVPKSSEAIAFETAREYYRSYGDARKSQPQGLLNDTQLDLRRSRSQRLSDADLRSLARDRVGDHAINA